MDHESIDDKIDENHLNNSMTNARLQLNSLCAEINHVLLGQQMTCEILIICKTSRLRRTTSTDSIRHGICTLMPSLKMKFHQIESLSPYSTSKYALMQALQSTTSSMTSWAITARIRTTNTSRSLLGSTVHDSEKTKTCGKSIEISPYLFLMEKLRYPLLTSRLHHATCAASGFDVANV